jgi:hypothetical protein
MENLMNVGKKMSFGELVTRIYDHYMELYDDEELAAVATAVTVQDGFLPVEALPCADAQEKEANAA